MIKRSECKCSCHVSGGMHIVACCYEDKSLAERLAEIIVDDDV